MSGAAARAVRVLVVDDDQAIRRALTSILGTRGYRVLLAATAGGALELAARERPDVILLDLTLPDRSGVEVCRELRSWASTPILVLSIHSGVADKIAALDAGADDYLTKPFSAGELLARVRALLRRAADDVKPVPVIDAGRLAIDMAGRRVRIAGADVTLTPTEFDILAHLARSGDVVVTWKQLVERVWGREWQPDDKQTLRSHISHLRRKLETPPGGAHYIVTEPGVGFRFNANAGGATALEERDRAAS